ncbi:hypothetical protein K432DRAFT_354452 [Lepidopterella palustris CBS 459.81]|uniref:DUF676 domain-containing protein n=1 Tax=Lepidopterella palustris CBS 459.81 TaxID=1314670 RepID=A0A8E2E9G8_9PEZI|nr:hypothetical protein K432DRAFT_354452 [Lepidopterella palustris CBS 459.81]
MGLQVLYPAKDAGKAEVLKADIVAVHGLNGDSKNTWTNSKTNAFWLQDFLPQDLPNARVMTFGYNASAAFGNTTADIIDHAKSLLSSLVDKREEADELSRPIVFIGHSLGGIVIKQALFQAKIEPRYNSISESTIGIVFLGTPHRGSEKAVYGKVLASLATTLLNKPSPRLVKALQVNSEALMRLTTDFRFQLPKYQVYSFYETKPMKMLSTLVVEKHSALLEIDGEEQIPVDADHEEMCKFIEREDDVYEKLFKRIRRMIKEQDGAHLDGSRTAIFTGRDNTIRKICEACLPSDTGKGLSKQKRFVLYGLGGSGKTQTCLKFAEDYREKFWGIFWIDASSRATAQQGFREISRICGVDEDPKVVRQWLSNAPDHWLLIIDNADDPSIDVSEFFPTGNRGSILLTTRNPDFKIHSLASCEFDQMNSDEAVTLFLRATGAEDTTDEAARKKAMPIAEILGYLPLAIAQAGAYVRQGVCSIEEYCNVYTRHRERLLRYRPVQANSDYKYSVYTTWEISIEAIERMSSKTSHNAIELIRTFCFMHYDGITETIFQQAWRNSSRNRRIYQDISYMFYMYPQGETMEWDPIVIREAAVLLASFSLIKIDGASRRMSMHPLVHVWARDRLSEELQGRYWVTASSTLAATMSWEYQLFDYRFRQSLIPHIQSCINFYKGGPFISRDSKRNRVDMAAGFAVAFAENGRGQEAMELREMVLEASQRTLGNEHPDTLNAMNNLAIYYSRNANTRNISKEISLVKKSRRRDIFKRWLPGM